MVGHHSKSLVTDAQTGAKLNFHIFFRSGDIFIPKYGKPEKDNFKGKLAGLSILLRVPRDMTSDLI